MLMGDMSAFLREHMLALPNLFLRSALLLCMLYGMVALVLITLVEHVMLTASDEKLSGIA